MDFGSMLNKLKRDAQVASTAPPPGAKRSRPNDEAEVGAFSTDEPAVASTTRRKWPTTAVDTIYLVCPPNVQTGGPEAMHQLCHALNTNSRFAGQAKMLYLREDAQIGVRHAKGAERLPAYGRYNAPAAAGLPGESEKITENGDAETGAYSSSLIVWPECWTNLIDCQGIRRKNSCHQIQCHQTCIWWLSVDNNNGKFKDWGREDILHLYQSEYARRHLIKNGAKHTLQMSEYIPDRSSDSSGTGATAAPATAMVAASSNIARDLEVLYNPLKGIHYTDEIKRRSGRGKDAIKFTPIGGGSDGQTRISPEDVVKMLQRAKVYMDFGPHPGMDRLPREAALAGCIVITNGEGAANYDEDVPIPPEYKIRKFDVDRIHRLLRQSLDDSSKADDFDQYRKWIQGQAARMDECVNGLLDEIGEKREK